MVVMQDANDGTCSRVDTNCVCVLWCLKKRVHEEASDGVDWCDDVDCPPS